MNKIRRKNLQSIIDQLEELKGSLEDLQAEEEEYRDNIPENMRESERYHYSFPGKHSGSSQASDCLMQISQPTIFKSLSL